MKAKKQLTVIISVLLLAITILIYFRIGDIRAIKAQGNFLSIIEGGDFDDLSLTIYYLKPYSLTLKPWSIEDIVRAHDYKVVIDGKTLEEHVELLKQLGNIKLKPFHKGTYLDARIYYVFKTEKKGDILEVAMWGSHDELDALIVFVNGVSVIEGDIFHDIVMPFLPEEAVKELQDFLCIDIQ